MEKKGKDVRSVLRRQAVWRHLAPMCRYEPILKSVGKWWQVILGHLLAVQVLKAKALSAVNRFQRLAPRAHMPYFYGEEH